MARTLQDILAEVTAQSDPQRQIVLKQIAALPTQQAADEAALGAQKDQAYSDILAGARRRGLGFSGIPLGEQAKYAATDYAPALAKLKTGYGTQRSTLESALAGIGQSNYATANDIFNQERNFAEQQRQFNENLAEQRRQAASQNAAFGSLLGGGGTPQQPVAPPPTNPLHQDAYNDARTRIDAFRAGKLSDTALRQDYAATVKSASYKGYWGDRARAKLEIYHQLFPEFFGNQVSSNVLANGNQLRF